jgi:DNA-binding MarR family transcriptional regulator
MTRRKHPAPYNSLKKRVLEIFDRANWLSPGEIAVQIRMFPIRGAWGYLKRLWRWGLLRRRRGAGGRLVYAITMKGRRRLAWLEGWRS